MRRCVFLFLVLGLWTACGSPQPGESGKQRFHYYFFVGHPRQWPLDSRRVDADLECLRLDKFDMRLLGGDMTAVSSDHDSVMQYLDGLFDLDAPGTLWALGNHDRHKKDSLFMQYTKRPAFFATTRNRTVWAVIDTQDYFSHIHGDQLEMFRHIADTIDKSVGLVVVSHKLTYMYGHPELQPICDSVSNATIGEYQPNRVNPNDFWEVVYPLLTRIRDKGKFVLWLSGDVGFRVPRFRYRTPEGVQFLASGMNSGDKRSEVLLLRQDNWGGRIDYRFVVLRDLLDLPGMRRANCGK